MPERAPLAGKRILLTRAAEQSAEWTSKLEALGAEVSLLPVVSYAEVEDTQELDSSILRLAEFDWLILSSTNAVRFFAARCGVLGIVTDARMPGNLSVAAVGPATAAAATEAGWKVAHTAREHSGKGLAREIRGDVQGRRVLLPRSNRAGSALPDDLRDAGAVVTSVVAYRTMAPAEADAGLLERMRRKEFEVIVFASPSAVHNLFDLYAERMHAPAGSKRDAELAAGVVFATIGPSTAQAVREAGLSVAIVAREATAASLAEAIAGYFEARAEREARQEA